LRSSSSATISWAATAVPDGDSSNRHAPSGRTVMFEVKNPTACPSASTS